MAGETVITVVGNLTADPELKFTQNAGVARTSFTVASTSKIFDKQANQWRDGDTLFLRCTAWREVAENIANTLKRGMRVIVRGSLSQRSYDDEKGERRTIYELTVDEVGPSLRFATAEVTRTPPRGQAAMESSSQDTWSKPSKPIESGNEWANPGQSFDDAEAPF